MSRAVLPVVASSLAGGAFWGWQTWIQKLPIILVEGVSGQLVESLVGSILRDFPELHWIWLAGGAYLLWDFRTELHLLFRGVLQLFIYLICLINLVFGWIHRVLWLASYLLDHHCHLGWLATKQAERGDFLTCMAVVAAAPNYPPGSFLLVSRPPDWDDVWIAGHTQDGKNLLCRTTVSDGSSWMWTLIEVIGPHLVAPTLGVNQQRRAPNGVQQQDVNWLCVPPAAQDQWNPGAADVAVLMTEAHQLLTQLQTVPSNSLVSNKPGVGGDLTPLQMGGGGALAPGGGGVAMGEQNPGAAALGLGAGNSQQSREMDLKALESAVQQLQALALNDSDRPRKHSRSKDKKHKKSKKKSKKERKHKKKSRKSRGSSSSSPSSSNSSRSRSRSSSSSSSTKKPLRWKEGGKSKSVSYSDLAHVDQLKFKKKGDLVAFAAKHPGALTAHFLAGVFTRLSKGTLAKSSQLRDVSVTSWAHQFAGLSELRDMKEVLTLAEILDHVNRREIARALDVLVQRILAIQAAKMKGGSWEKAEGIELVNTNKTLASSSMLALTNG